MSTAKLGSGKRFSALHKQLEAKHSIHNPDALAASIGPEKLGKAKFQALAEKGRERAAKK